MKTLLTLSLIALAATLHAGPVPLVILDDGTLLAPSAAAPLSAEQANRDQGNAFLARWPDGRVILATAGHVAAVFKIPFRKIADDIAVIREWAPGTYPEAEKLPEIAKYEEGVPVRVVSWSKNRGEVIDREFAAKPLNHYLTEIANGITVAGKKFVMPDGEPLSLDYWRTRAIEYRERGRRYLHDGDVPLGPGCSGSLVLQNGKAVGVISGGTVFNLEDHVLFQTLLPSGRQPRGLPPWAR